MNTYWLTKFHKDARKHIKVDAITHGVYGICVYDEHIRPHEPRIIGDPVRRFYTKDGRFLIPRTECISDGLVETLYESEELVCDENNENLIITTNKPEQLKEYISRAIIDYCIERTKDERKYKMHIISKERTREEHKHLKMVNKQLFD